MCFRDKNTAVTETDDCPAGRIQTISNPALDELAEVRRPNFERARPSLTDSVKQLQKARNERLVEKQLASLPKTPLTISNVNKHFDKQAIEIALHPRDNRDRIPKWILDAREDSIKDSRETDEETADNGGKENVKKPILEG